MPAGTIAAIPVPNIVMLIMSVFNFEFLQLLEWYIQTITFTSISYVITLAIIGLISQVIFFEYKRR
jgi:hypothetical protein